MSSDYISDLLLERYILKELPEKKAREVEKFLRNNPEELKRLEAIKSSNTEILNEYPAEKMAAEIMHRYTVQKPGAEASAGLKREIAKRIGIPSFAIAAAAVILIFLFPVIRPVNEVFKDNNDIEVTRIKGKKTALFIYRKRGGIVEQLKEGSVVREKDLVQIAYFSAEDTNGVILSIDGRRAVTLHFPENKKAPTKLEKGKKTLLQNSYELDDAPQFERFFLITSKGELNVNEILKAAEELASMPVQVLNEDIRLETSAAQTSVLIRKGE